MELLAYLNQIPDHRRAQARQYELGPLLFFSILAILSGATSYRNIQSFISAHLDCLNDLFKLTWKRAPAHTSVRYAFIGMEVKNLEKIFRQHAKQLHHEATGDDGIAMDGKVLRGSFDHFNDQKAAQVLSALAASTTLILGHSWIEEKDGQKGHEIPAVQALVHELGITGQLYTLDALHTQKNCTGSPGI